MGHHGQRNCRKERHPIGTWPDRLLKHNESTRHWPPKEDPRIRPYRCDARRRCNAILELIIGVIVVFGAQHRSSDPWRGVEGELRKAGKLVRRP